MGVISLIALTREQQAIKIIFTNSPITFAMSHQYSFRGCWRRQGGSDNIQKIFLTMIENMDQGVLVVSLDQKIKFANQTALKILGVNQEIWSAKRLIFVR